MKSYWQPCVYILTNHHNGALYTGVTSNLLKRMDQHREGQGSGFARRYRATKLVYVEQFQRMDEAIAREKQIKGGSRQKKIDLVNTINPEWKDLFEDYLT